MTFPRARLIVAVVLFVAWLGFLISLVARSQGFAVVSRPQLASADAIVLARLTANGSRSPKGEATIVDVIWAKNGEVQAKLAGRTIPIPNLEDATSDQGFRGDGEYVLPIWAKETKDGDRFLVASIPQSPGYFSEYSAVYLNHAGPQPDDVKQAIAEHLQMGPEEAKTLVEGAPGFLTRSASRKQLDGLRKALTAANALVQTRANDLRIYRATPPTLEHLQFILKEWGR